MARDACRAVAEGDAPLPAARTAAAVVQRPVISLPRQGAMERERDGKGAVNRLSRSSR
jgi:hypothetical protein